MRYFLTHACVLCGQESGNNMAICPGCLQDLPWIGSGCKTCGLPLPHSTGTLLCGECLTSESPFTTVVTPLHYRSPVDRIITSFKHRSNLARGDLLAQLLASAIRKHYFATESNSNPLPELLLPVPLHWRRFVWRGYNQAHELGKRLSSALDIPCDNTLLKRTRQTPSQQGLSRRERLRNLQNVFTVTRQIPCRRIAILDDVVTTGSTATELAQVLLDAGAGEIHLWAVARTPMTE